MSFYCWEHLHCQWHHSILAAIFGTIAKISIIISLPALSVTAGIGIIILVSQHCCWCLHHSLDQHHGQCWCHGITVTDGIGSSIILRTQMLASLLTLTSWYNFCCLFHSIVARIWHHGTVADIGITASNDITVDFSIVTSSVSHAFCWHWRSLLCCWNQYHYITDGNDIRVTVGNGVKELFPTSA